MSQACARGEGEWRPVAASKEDDHLELRARLRLQLGARRRRLRQHRGARLASRPSSDEGWQLARRDREQRGDLDGGDACGGASLRT